MVVVAGAMLGGGFAAPTTASDTTPIATMPGNPVYTEASSGSMWICGGPKSKRYHSTRNCSGLKRCSRTPRKISLSEARARHYTPCRRCC